MTRLILGYFFLATVCLHADPSPNPHVGETAIPPRQQLDPCTDFWAYACSSPLLQKRVPTEIDPNRARLVEKVILDDLENNGFLIPLRNAITENGDPLLNVSRLTTIDNYDKLYKDKGKNALYEHAAKYFIKDPVFDTNNAYLTATVAVRKIFREWKPSPQSELAIMVKEPILEKTAERKFPKLLKLMYEELPEDKFVQVIKDLATLGHDEYLSELETSLGKDPKFRDRVENEIQSPESKKRWENLLAETKTAAKKIGGLNLSVSDNTAMDNINVGSPSQTDSEFREIATVSGGHAESNKLRVWGGTTDFEDDAARAIVAHEYGHAVVNLLNSTKANIVDDTLGKCLSDPAAAGVTEKQKREAEAEWFMTESVMSSTQDPDRQPALTREEKEKAYVNLVVDCRKEPPTNDPHPTGKVRANRIVMANLDVRTFFNCPATDNPKYCSFVKRDGSPK
jgi:hypothetical protein